MSSVMDYDLIERRARRAKLVRSAVVYGLLLLWALVVLFPFYWMVMTSLKGQGAYASEITPQLYAADPTWQNYVSVFTQADLGRYFLNTFLFTVLTTAAMLAVTVLAAFAFARLDFPGKGLVFLLFLALMMIPGELVIITNYVTVKKHLGLANTFLGLILPSVSSVFYIYLLKENFAQIPDELYYAAKVDATSDLKYLGKVMVPICRPTIVTILILKVIECWNSYVWPRLIVDEEMYVVSLGIQEIRQKGLGRDNIPAMMAAVVAVSVPLILLFLIFHKKIMAGVAKGGMKG